MTIRHLLFLILVHMLVGRCLGQPAPDSLIAVGNKLGKQYISVVSDKAEKISGQLEKQTEKYLAKLEKQEARLQKKLSKIDSLAANKIFVDAKQQYQQLQGKIKSKSEQLRTKTAKYLPWLDSSATSLQFLQKNPVLNGLKGDAGKLNGAMAKVKELQNQLKEAASVKDFIRERKEYLKQQLQQYNLGNELKKYNQTAYYYSQQINEYRQVLNDPEKAERKALDLLNKMPAFQEFMQKNSILARFFPAGDVSTNTASAAGSQIGLQTRASLQQVLQNQFGTSGPNVQAIISQNVQSSQSMMDMLRDKVNTLGGSLNGEEMDMPEFKVNTQKTKSFLRRLEYGVNLQTVKSSYFFPTTLDFGFSIGYKLNSKSMIGAGLSYKLGIGKDISHISLTHEGIGIRSFLDVKAKGSFYISGGFEYNYQQPFRSLRDIQTADNWSKSGLLGISKMISLKTKVFKKTKLQLLWDFLSYQQRPVTPPFKFRVGYSF